MPRILVTGSRDWDDETTVCLALWTAYCDLKEHGEVILVSGNCPTGADNIAERFWESNGMPVERHPADWKTFGKAAGPKRNQEMVDLGADVCLAFPMKGSRGTMHCMKAAKAAGIPLKIYPYTTRDEEAFT
jgi:hypothetical protein